MHYQKSFSMILLMLISSQVLCQTGTLLIYDSGTLGIKQFKSFKHKNLPQKQIYVQTGHSYSPPPPNTTGSFIKLDRQTNLWYNPYNGFVNSHWAYDNVNSYWICSRIGDFIMDINDSNFILRYYLQLTKFGGINDNKLTWNSGISEEESIEIPHPSVFCGFDIDTLDYSNLPASYYYGYNNHIFRVYNYGGSLNQVIISTITGLKSFSEGGFLKVNPFKRNYIFTVSDKMMLSTNSGDNFFSINIPPVKKLIFNEADNSIYGYSSVKLYRSTDNGLVWDSLTLPNNFNTLEANPDSAGILYGGSDNGLYKSDNKGVSWYLYNNSFTTSAKVIGISKDKGGGDTLFVCTDMSVYKVWSSFIVGVNNISTEIPDKFQLYQNYPNPFNPSTFISYSLRENSFVRLKVYDVLGNEIATLVNEKQNTGNYNYQFSTAKYQLSSGIYFYKLEAGNFSETKRMILLK